MSTILFNTKDASDYFDPLAGLSDSPHYMIGAKSTQWDDDLVAPDIEDTEFFTDYQMFDEMIFGKRITASDIAKMAKRYDWESGTVYDYYDDKDSNLASKEFYVVIQEAGSYHVFKCLDNASGSPSTSQPKVSETSAADNQYYTADGYHWKYIYSITDSAFTKFATPDYIPVYTNTDVSSVASNGAISTIIVDEGGANYLSYAQGVIEEIAVGGNTQIFAIGSSNTTLSANNNFYTGSVLYIKSGAGAGEMRDIINYEIDGTKRKITVNSAFGVLPDLTSTYDISPKVTILGDGEGAKAISVVNTSTKSIQNILMVEDGLNYTYANVSVTGNTGSLVIANSAVVRAIISPKGGHGFDPYSEFGANKISVSTTFSNADVNIPVTNEYRRIGILANPKYDGVILQISNASAGFIEGETVSQLLQDTFNIDVYNSDEYEYSLTYDISKYKVLQFSAPVDFANGNYVHSTSGNTYGVVVNKISQNSLLLRTDQGAWVNSSTVTLVSNASVNGVVSSITAGYSNGTIYGLDGSNTDFTYSSLTDKYNVFVNNTAITPSILAAPSDPQYSINSTAVQITNIPITNSSIVYLDKYHANTTLATITSNTELFVSGQTTSVNATHLILSNVSGIFSNTLGIVGQDSSATANVTSVTGQEDTFDNRVKLFGAYEIGSGTFAVQDQVFQYDDSNTTISAFGTIHEIIPGTSNTYTIALTEIKGNFDVSSNATNKYIRSEDSSKVLVVTSKTVPYVARYTGEILYAENMLPVERTPTQTEKLNVVLSFY